MKKNSILVLILLALVHFFTKNYQDKNIKDTNPLEKPTKNKATIVNSVITAEKNLNKNGFQSKSIEVIQENKQNAPGPDLKTKVDQKEELTEQNLLTYIIDDGLAVVQGDIIIGEVPRDKLLKSLSGFVHEPPLKTWPTSDIPFYIQPNLPNAERVNEALTYFSGTNIHFVPYVNQEDVIVFQNGQGTCKSYLGYIGGKQPIFLSEACSAHEIAHEIMHALGFIHEQNRNDRDNYIDIIWTNIDSRYNINFEKFSNSLMRVSGFAKFDLNPL